jgi:hypothetical protein
MYGRATKKLTAKFILRTLDRLQMVTRYNETVIADLLLKNNLANRDNTHHPAFLGEYLSRVAECMEKKSGHSANDHPHGPCDQCGKPVSVVHNGARFCSSTCRQKAYRLRLKQKASGRNVTNSQCVTHDVPETEDKT